MWWVQDAAVQLGRTGEILVSLRHAPRDADEVVRILRTAFSFETLEFATDTDEKGVTTEWVVLINAKFRTPEVAVAGGGAG